MEPFNLTKIARDFKNRYPSLSELKDFHKKAEYTEKLGSYRAWLTEGIPYAFSESPLLFEKIREFIGKSIGVQPSDIKLVGSARTGYALDPSKSGNLFSASSDLDFAIVSLEYFLECEEQFLKFKSDYEKKLIHPNNPNQAKWWPKIIHDVEMQRVERGFVDIFKVPTLPGYLTAQKSIDTCWRVTKKLEATSFGPKVKKCSTRVYRDTKSFIKQVNTNFQSCLG